MTKAILQALAVAALGALIGFTLSFIVPPRYPVSLLLEIGRVPELTALGLERSALIDPPATVASSIRQSGTKTALAREFNGTVTPSELDELVRRTDARVLTPADIVEVSVWSVDPELATRWLDRLTRPIIEKHDALFMATVGRYRSDLKVASARLQEIDAQIRSLVNGRQANATREGLGDLSYSQTLSMLDLSRRYWHERTTTLEASLDQRILRRTQLAAPPSVESDRALPKRSLLVSLGALLAFLAWGAWRIVRTRP